MFDRGLRRILTKNKRARTFNTGDYVSVVFPMIKLTDTNASSAQTFAGKIYVYRHNFGLEYSAAAPL